MSKQKLPVTNSEGFFEIRLESIGGLGANVAGKIIAEAGVLYAGFNGSNFASYGSEKKGSPVKSFIRFSDPSRPIRNATPVERPHVLGVFHEALLAAGQSVIGGLYADSILIVNSRRKPEEIREMLGLKGVRIGTIRALDIANEEGSRVNMAMIGAIAQACPFLTPEAIEASIQRNLGHYPRFMEGNLKTFRRGYNEVVWSEPTVAAGEATMPFVRPEPVYGYATGPIGGTLPTPGNSVNKDLSASRQGYLPQFLRDKCIDCAQCELACPDFCFVWEEGTDKRGRPVMVLKGIDYQYCKGCLKCVEVCPTEALITVEETDGFTQEHGVAHFWKRNGVAVG